MTFFKETGNIVREQPSGNSSTSEKQPIVARVRDVILSSNHREWEKYGGPSSLGVIKYEILTQGKSSNNRRALQAAYPLYSNLRHIPLKNEIVLIISNPAETLDESNVVPIIEEKKYYTDIISIWNHPHHNAWVDGEEQNVGRAFQEQSISPLQPYEGDIIFEGRNGQSLRFSTNYRNTPWQGQTGAPITVLRNGQNGFDPTNLINEDIDTDPSSIYLTSNQKLTFTPANNNFISYQNEPTKGNDFSDPQILFNSDRIYLNARQENILLDAKKSVGLSGQEIHVNANDSVVVEAKKIQLGKNAKQGILLGKDTVDLLDSLLQELFNVANALTQAISTPPKEPIIPLVEAGAGLKSKIRTLRSKLNSLPSKKAFVK